MNLMKATAALLLCSFASVTASADVWTSANTWSPAFEDKYANWVNESVKEDIFSNSQSPWYGIKTDCADAAYTIRIIFAYENRLPILWRNSKRGEMMSERMKNWDNLGETKRVIAFINYVNEATGTYTMANDTYPVKISPSYVRPGAMYLQPKRKPITYVPSVLTNGHVYFVKDVTAGGSILYMSSTVPQDVRVLGSRYDNPFAPLKSDSGFRIWKQPQDYDKSESSLPGYSLEQFNIVTFTDNMVNPTTKVAQYRGWVQGKLMQKKETVDDQLNQYLHNVCGQIRDRMAVIADAQRAIRNQNGKCLRGTAWEDYSTPSRDKRLLEDFEKLRSLVGSKYRSWDMEAVSNHPRACTYEIVPGKTWNLAKFYKFSTSWKTDPNYSTEGRWGLTTRGGEGLDCQR